MAEYNYITSQGVIVPDTAAIRADVEAEWRAAFGEDLVTTPETPQGVIITLQTEERDAIARNNAALANQINPDIAGGVFLDALLSFTGGVRRAATRSTLAGVVFSGVPGTNIPAGSQAIVSGTGEVFTTDSPLVIGSGGTVTGSMTAVNAGAIQVPIAGLDTVASAVLGWETVTNPASAVPGAPEQSDVAARALRRQTLAQQTVSTTEAIVSRVMAIPEVRSMSFRENTAATTQTIDGISMVAKSIYACVQGGSNADVARALYDTKTVGAAYNGGTTVNVTDPFSGQVTPVKFDRPTEIPILVRVTVRPTPLDVQTLVRDAIMDYVNGDLEGGMGLTVGVNVYPFEFSGACNQIEPSIVVTNVELSTDGTTWSSAPLAVALDEVATLQRSSITVNIV
jgi:hypothetical protein